MNQETLGILIVSTFVFGFGLGFYLILTETWWKAFTSKHLEPLIEALFRVIVIGAVVLGISVIFYNLGERMMKSQSFFTALLGGGFVYVLGVPALLAGLVGALVLLVLLSVAALGTVHVVAFVLVAPLFLFAGAFLQAFLYYFFAFIVVMIKRHPLERVLKQRDRLSPQEVRARVIQFQLSLLAMDPRSKWEEEQKERQVRAFTKRILAEADLVDLLVADERRRARRKGRN